MGEAPLEHALRELPLDIVNTPDEAILLFEQGIGCDHAPRWFLLTGTYEGREVWTPPSNCEADWPACRAFSEAPQSCLLCQTFYAPIYIEAGGRYRSTWRAATTLDVELPEPRSADGEVHSCWAPTPLPTPPTPSRPRPSPRASAPSMCASAAPTPMAAASSRAPSTTPSTWAS